MIFSQGTSYRNIYPQSGLFNFSVNLSLDNTTGISTFGFSGNSQNIEFKCASGQILLNSPTNLLLSYYSKDEQKIISGSSVSRSYDVWVNNQPYALGLNKNTGYYNYFYVQSQNVNTDLSLQIYGESPKYSYDPFESYYSGQIIPLTLTNSGSYPFKIFSGNISNNNNFSLSGVNGLDVTGSKNINLISNNFSSAEQTIPINLYTNFGEITLNFTASGIPLNSGQFYLFFGPDNTSIVSQIPNNYVVTVKSFTGVKLITSLEYISGITGNYYKDVLNTGMGTGNVSGLITGSGTLSNTITNPIYKFNLLNSVTESGTGTGIISKYIVASGNISGNFETPLTGLASGLIPYTTGVTGYGVFTFNGIVTPAGGILTRSDLTGIGSGYNAANGLFFGTTTSGVGSIFARYTGDLGNITGVFNNSEYELLTFSSPLFYYTGSFNKYYNLSALAYATGRLITGKLQSEFGFNFEPGIYIFSKGWTGVGSGRNAIIDSFDPVLNKFSVTGTSGLIGGVFTTGLTINGCDFEQPYIIPTGIPSSIYNSTGGLVAPLSIFVMTPLNTGEYTGENAFNLSSRTNISRRGETPSGSGYFDNIFQQPFYNDGIWTESLSGQSGLLITNKSGIIKTISANPFLYNDTISGYFRVSGTYNGYQSFIWNGRVTGDFSDYTTLISGIDNPLRKTYINSYNFEMLLRTGIYAFFLYPSISETGTPSTESPFISFPSQVDVFENENNAIVPFQLLYPSDSTIKLSFDYEDKTAREYINYLSTNKEIVFENGQSGFKYLNIPIINNSIQDGNSYFKLNITDISGGYVANRTSLLNTSININIIDDDIPINDPSCCDPTGIDATPACLKYVGGKVYSGYNGIYYNTVIFDSAVKSNEILNFKTRFVAGLGDNLVMKGYILNSSPVTLLDTQTQNYVSGEMINISETLSLPSNAYAIKTEVIAASESNTNDVRCPWYLVLGCAEQDDRLNDIEEQILQPVEECYDPPIPLICDGMPLGDWVFEIKKEEYRNWVTAGTWRANISWTGGESYTQDGGGGDYSILGDNYVDMINSLQCDQNIAGSFDTTTYYYGSEGEAVVPGSVPVAVTINLGIVGGRYYVGVEINLDGGTFADSNPSTATGPGTFFASIGEYNIPMRSTWNPYFSTFTGYVNTVVVSVSLIHEV